MTRRSSRQQAWITPTLFLLATLAGCRQRVETATQPVGKVAKASATVQEVENFCGACHRTPLPESFPKDRWLHEVERGYQFYLLSDRTDLRMPRQSGVVQYFQAWAPQSLVLLAPPPLESQPRFERVSYAWPGKPEGAPAVAHLQYLKVAKDEAGSLAVCDMRNGAVDWLTISDREIRSSHRQTLKHPVHLVPTDLDANGDRDYLVADLGSFLPEDHQRGRLVWLAPRPDGRKFDQHVLLDNVGRVADAAPADFDGDGDLDIVVAVFGWQTSGGILLLRRADESAGIPKFTTEVLDPRSGAIHTCVTDLNADQLPDVVALISQEHEAVESFVNQPGGGFKRQLVYRAPDPSYGSSGIQLIDFDADGDQDVLYTNGDTFDSYYVKPYHSVRWIENLGNGDWTDHLVMNLPGVHRALAGDLDGDGDLDLAACCFIPSSARERQSDAASFASLVWIERRGKELIPHAVELDNCVHAAMELADVNGDGAVDIIAGSFDATASSQELRPFDVWLNRRPPGKAIGATQ